LRTLNLKLVTLSPFPDFYGTINEFPMLDTIRHTKSSGMPRAICPVKCEAYLTRVRVGHHNTFSAQGEGNMIRVKGIVLGALTAAVTVLPCAHAGSEIETMRGIKGINVSIDTRIADKVNVSFNKEMIKTYVEALLKNEGITLLSEEAFFAKHGSARLRLNVQIAKHTKEDTIYAYNIEVELRQNVLLERNRKISFSSPTWEEQVTGIVFRDYVEETVKDSAKRLLERFLEAYATANPGQPEPSSLKQ